MVYIEFCMFIMLISPIFILRLSWVNLKLNINLLYCTLYYCDEIHFNVFKTIEL